MKFLNKTGFRKPDIVDAIDWTILTLIGAGLVMVAFGLWHIL